MKQNQISIRTITTTISTWKHMKPSFSSARVTVDSDNGRPHFHDNGDVVVLRALSPRVFKRCHSVDCKEPTTPTLSVHLLLQGASQSILAGGVVSIGMFTDISI